jgi:hypothetical protein
VTSPDSVAPPRTSNPVAPEPAAAVDPSRSREGIRSRER